MTIAIFGKKTSVEIFELIYKLINKLIKKNIEVLVYETFYEELELKKYFPRIRIFSSHQDLKNSTKLMFTFGGDGTLLSVIPIIKDLPIPIIGINTGRLGFLTTTNKEDLFNNLDLFINQEFKISHRSLLTINGNFFIDSPFALNEIAITRKETTAMITIEAFIGDEYLNTFWADGLIVSTPTGSTGYNLSCGGPIIFPENNSIIITPIAPHNLNVRPLVLPDYVTLKLRTSTRADEFYLSLDSRLVSLSTKTELIIKKCDFTIQIAINPSYSYYKTLRQKLLWGTDSRN